MPVVIAIVAAFLLSGCATLSEFLSTPEDSPRPVLKSPSHPKQQPATRTISATMSVESEPQLMTCHDHQVPVVKSMPSEDSLEMQELRLIQLVQAAAILRNEKENPSIQEDYFCRKERTFSWKFQVPDRVRKAVDETPNLGKHKALAAYYLVRKLGEYAVCGKEDKNTPQVVEAARDIVIRMGPIPIYRLVNDSTNDPNAIGYRLD